MLLASGFAVLALGLAGFGLFGLLSSHRRPPLVGVRHPDGARRVAIASGLERRPPRDVARRDRRDPRPAVRPVGGRLVSSLFFGVDPRDWTTFLAATLTLVAVTAACSIFPALRASRVDPIVALRDE